MHYIHIKNQNSINVICSIAKISPLHWKSHYNITHAAHVCFETATFCIPPNVNASLHTGVWGTPPKPRIPSCKRKKSTHILPTEVVALLSPMDFPTTSLNVDPNVGSMFGTMFAQDVNWCDRELFVHFEIRALTFKSKIISKKSLQTQEQLLQIARWDERDGNLCERCHQAFGENCVMWICDTMAHVDCIDFSKFLLCWTTLLDIGCILYRR